MITISFSLLSIIASGQVKLITSGEHLGFSIESIDNNDRLVKLGITQGEVWTAVYTQDGTFVTKKERLTWDTAQNFAIRSISDRQPTFYFQGIDSFAQSGQASSFSWDDFRFRKPMKWTFNKNSFLILYSSDSNCTKLAPKKYGVIGTDNELTVFKGVSDAEADKITLTEENIVRLYWTGDLNGDGNPDFLIGIKSHHEMPIFELIVSKKVQGKLTWKRLARFTEWS